MWPRDLVRRQRAAHLRHVQREQVQRDELRRERLGRGDADLRPGVRVDGAVGLARGHAADDVADGDAARRPSLRASRSAASVSAVSPDCVMTIASSFCSTIGSAVAILGAVVHFDRHPRQRSIRYLPTRPACQMCRTRAS